jgi:hypothetical protein
MTSAFEFIIYSLAITGGCLIIDSCIMAFLNRNPNSHHNAERSHYLLSILSIVVYLIAYQADSETFRNIWMQVLFGLYLFDLSIIARDWSQLKPSYRTFYSVHHAASLGLFFIWYHTFIPFTDAMALGGLLWVSSDIWRWAEQYWRLSGRISTSRLRDIVWYAERSHRLLAYGIYMWVLDFSFNHTAEMILLGSGILMDIIDTYFQQNARSAYKFKQQAMTLEGNKEPLDEAIINTKKAA